MTVDPTWQLATVYDQMSTYIMFRPVDVGNGAQWVPVYRWMWNWAANIGNPGSLVTPVVLGNPTITDRTRKPRHPEWNCVINAANGTYEPTG